MEDKSCCFTGHRKLPTEHSELTRLYKSTEKAIKSLADKGYTVFYSGGAMGFDTIAAIKVLKLKAEGYKIKLVVAIPYPNQSESWDNVSKSLYEKVLSEADEKIIVCDEFKKSCYAKRNRFMVDNSSACIYYMLRERTGTSQTVSYAAKKGLELIPVK